MPSVLQSAIVECRKRSLEYIDDGLIYGCIFNRARFEIKIVLVVFLVDHYVNNLLRVRSNCKICRVSRPL